MGFFKGFRDYMSPPQADFESLRSDLQNCIDELDARDANRFLSWYSAWGSPLADVPDAESFLAVAPIVALRGRGLLVLTSKRLLFSGEFGQFEVPAHRLSMTGLGVDRHATTLQVAVAPNNDPVYEFGISTLQDATRSRFLNTLEVFVRETEGRGNGEAPKSTADELAKFARLRDQGVITEDEFAAKKAQLLSE
jgi:Short C-terminal domain